MLSTGKGVTACRLGVPAKQFAIALAHQFAALPITEDEDVAGESMSRANLFAEITASTTLQLREVQLYLGYFAERAVRSS